jgi:hypothetical protein
MPLIIPRVLFYADSSNEDGPKRNELYVMIEDGSVRSFHDLTRKLDWDIVEKEEGFFYHTTQDQELKSCFVRYSGWADEEAMKGIRALGILQEKQGRGETVTPMDAAIALGDPVQTSALEKFTRGELSYAEMRGLCG